MKQIALLVVLLAYGSAWADAGTSVDLRYTGSFLTQSGELEHDRVSVYGERDQPLFTADDGNFVGDGKLSLLGLSDRIDPRRELIVRELYADLLAGHLSMRAGWQDITWSETFGFFIADVVNPRDLRDPKYTDPQFARLPVFALKPQWTMDNITLQGVLTPVAHNMRYFDSFAGVPVLQPPPIKLQDYPHDLEAGGRVETLLVDKLDCALFYFHHLNRNLAVEEVATAKGPALQAVTGKVDSMGLTSSLALESIVFREDLVYTLHQPTTATDFGSTRNINAVQSILGVDYSSIDELTVGLQYQFETHPAPFHWLSVKISKRFSAARLQPELFVFRGIGNRDTWIQPQLNWYPGDRLSFSIRYDEVEAAEQTTGDFQGYLTPLRGSSRLMGEIQFKL